MSSLFLSLPACASRCSAQPVTTVPSIRMKQSSRCCKWRSMRILSDLRLSQPHAGEGSVEAPYESLSVDGAWEVLLSFNSKDAKGAAAQQLLDSKEKRARLREALLVAAASPHAPSGWDPHSAQPQGMLMGILSSDVRLGVRALRDYCQALGLPFKLPESRVPGCPALPAIAGSVFIKYNSLSGLCYATQYEGSFRGVLVQLGMQQIGHLPLGLMDEDRKNPPPSLE